MALDPVAAAAVRSLGGEIAQLNRRLAALENGTRTAGLKYSSIDGGALVVNDAAGQVRQVIGAQPDGTVTVTEAGAGPPAAPSAPLAAPAISALVIGWDGLLGGAGPLSDFLWCEVHVSTASGFTPGAATLKRTMQAGGVVTVAGLTPGTAYYAVLVAVNRSRTASPPSAQTSAVPLSTTQTIPAGSITPGLLSFTAGGTTVSIGPSAPGSPAVNDLWFDTGNGAALKQWSGSAWVPYQFGAQALSAGAITTPLLAAGAVTAAQIAAGSIDATRIQAGTITAGLLQSGIVVANIVNGTVITGSTLQNSASNPRTSINPDGSISITNAAGTIVFRIGPDGTIYWYSQSGTLLMSLAPGGTQLIYASLTGPAAPAVEPPSAPAVIMALFSAGAATSFVNPVSQATSPGDVLTVIVSAAGATDCTAVTDTQGNAYTLVQSCTATQHMQVFHATGATAALSTSDTITVTMGAANTQQKNFIALATSNCLTVTPLDFSAQASGTSAAVSVAGTPTAFADACLFIASWALAGGAGSGVPDGWQLAQQSQVSGGQYTTVWYTANATGSPLTGSAAITSAAWAAVILGYKAAPAASLAANSPVPLNATLSTSNQWSDEGNFSLRVTKAGAGTPWGVTYPAIPVQPGTLMALRVVVGTLNIALGNFEFGFNWWGGPNGTGTSLGASFWTYGAVPVSVFQAMLLYNCPVPAGAQSATVYAQEKQADVAGNWFLLDGIRIPGGLAYSNSPVTTADALGNPVPQGINFVGLPGATNAFGVTDPYQGGQLAAIDGAGNISGQTITAVQDVNLAGQSLTNDILPNYATGLVTRGWAPGNTGLLPWPSAGIGTADTALLELDFTAQPGRSYLLEVLPCDFIPTTAQQVIFRLRMTTDGSTPTTSSTELTGHSPAVMMCPTAGQNYLSPYMEFMPPQATTTPVTYRFLLTGSIQSTGTLKFQNLLEMRVMDLGNNAPANAGVTLGSGTSGGAGAQNYTETFYPLNTYSYDQWGQKNHNGSMFQGAYSGSTYDQHSWIVWANGSRGNGLATVLNYTVQSVTLRLLNLHSWYNSGMTVSMKYSTSGLPGNVPAISTEVASWHINEGQLLTRSLTPAQWAPWKTGGTWMVFKAGSTSLDRYGYFYGGGGSAGSMPMLTVKYAHLA